MKVVILAGGFGSRLSEETHLKPKPMVEIGGKPILWHIMKFYAAYGLTDFIICLGYKGYMIKEYFQTGIIQLKHINNIGKNANKNALPSASLIINAGKVINTKDPKTQ